MGPADRFRSSKQRLKPSIQTRSAFAGTTIGAGVLRRIPPPSGASSPVNNDSSVFPDTAFYFGPGTERVSPHRIFPRLEGSLQPFLMVRAAI